MNSSVKHVYTALFSNSCEGSSHICSRVGMIVLKTDGSLAPAGGSIAQSCRWDDEGMLAPDLWLGDAITGLERRIIRQGWVSMPRWGREAVTAILVATHNLRLYGPHSVFK